MENFAEPAARPLAMLPQFPPASSRVMLGARAAARVNSYYSLETATKEKQ